MQVFTFTQSYDIISHPPFVYIDEANPEDPNELSFKKGEKLHVHERKGNWWQARKADGLVGMIPSNYVRQQLRSIIVKSLTELSSSR